MDKFTPTESATALVNKGRSANMLSSYIDAVATIGIQRTIDIIGADKYVRTMLQRLQSGQECTISVDMQPKWQEVLQEAKQQEIFSESQETHVYEVRNMRNNEVIAVGGGHTVNEAVHDALTKAANLLQSSTCKGVLIRKAV